MLIICDLLVPTLVILSNLMRRTMHRRFNVDGVER